MEFAGKAGVDGKNRPGGCRSADRQALTEKDDVVGKVGQSGVQADFSSDAGCGFDETDAATLIGRDDCLAQRAQAGIIEISDVQEISVSRMFLAAALGGIRSVPPEAVMVTVGVLLLLVVGATVKVAVPSPLSTKVTPEGRGEPVSPQDGVGEPCAMTV